MKNQTTAILALLFTAGLLSAQGFNKVMPQDWISTISKNNAFNNPKHENIEGSPYYNETFFAATVSGVEVNLMVRYDEESDQIEIQDKDTKIYILPKESPYNLIFIAHLNYKLRLLIYRTGKDIAVNGYLSEIARQKNSSLFRRDRTVIRDEKQPKTTFESYSPAKFLKAKKEYYLELNTKIIPMPTKKEQIENLFPDKKELITAFFKANTISFKEESDLIKIVNFISNLMP